MTKKQLLALYICYLIPYVAGNAFLPFLPLYAIELGASSSFTGYYLAIAFASIAVGSMTAGWFSSRFNNRKLFIVIDCILGGIATALMGLAPNLFILTLITIFGWLIAGNMTAMILILTGMFSADETRGRTFGIISTALSFSALIGGAISGPIIEQFDYQGLFLSMGSLYSICFIASLFLEDSKQAELKKKKSDSSRPMNMVFWLIFIGSILIYIATFSTTMITPFIMTDLNFSPTAMGTVIAVGGAVNLPLPFIIGWLSDHIGRKWLLVTSYSLATVGVIVLMLAGEVWQFNLSRILVTLTGTSFALGSAILVDNSTPDEVDSALSWFATATWIGGIGGYLLSGIFIEQLGLRNSLIPAIIFATIATSLILAVRSNRKKAIVA